MFNFDFSDQGYAGMPKYLVTFAQTKEEFRLPELIALCKYFGVKLAYDQDAYRHEVKNPFSVRLLIC